MLNLLVNSQISVVPIVSFVVSTGLLAVALLARGLSAAMLCYEHLSFLVRHSVLHAMYLLNIDSTNSKLC